MTRLNLFRVLWISCLFGITTWATPDTNPASQTEWEGEYDLIRGQVEIGCKDGGVSEARARIARTANEAAIALRKRIQLKSNRLQAQIRGENLAQDLDTQMKEIKKLEDQIKTHLEELQFHLTSKSKANRKDDQPYLTEKKRTLKTLRDELELKKSKLGAPLSAPERQNLRMKAVADLEALIELESQVQKLETKSYGCLSRQGKEGRLGFLVVAEDQEALIRARNTPTPPPSPTVVIMPGGNSQSQTPNPSSSGNPAPSELPSSNP